MTKPERVRRAMKISEDVLEGIVYNNRYVDGRGWEIYTGASTHICICQDEHIANRVTKRLNGEPLGWQMGDE